MDMYAEYEASNQKIGRDDERLRIFKLIAELPLAACVCDREWLVLGMHHQACLFNAEIGFRSRLLTSLVPTPAEPSGHRRIGQAAQDPPEVVRLGGSAAAATGDGS